jgi:hypothetical protein
MDRRLQERIHAFMGVLPADLAPAQREEVEECLRAFARAALSRRMLPRDVTQVNHLLDRYIQRGKIDRKELFDLVAKITHYTYRGSRYRPGAADTALSGGR